MLNILVAGGAGFIGSHLCKRLLTEGHTVYCVDNLITGSKNNITSLLDNPKFNFFNHDVTVPLQELREINYIFHLASPASPNKKSERSYINFPIETLLANSSGTYNLLNLAKEKNARFLFASTSEVYGDPKVSPQPETYFGNVNPNGIRSVYDEGKRFGEAMSFGFLRKFGTDVRIVRIFNTYGPFMQEDDGRVVSAFINQSLSGIPITIFGTGEQTRSFCYVDDMVDGLIKAMATEGAKGQVINLGNDDERKIKDIATKIKEMTGSSSAITYEELPEDDPMVRKPDITKAKNLLSWQPTTSLEDGLKKTIEYFKNA
jgi:dTDP-glucose 4,6-dehydratase